MMPIDTCPNCNVYAWVPAEQDRHVCAECGASVPDLTAKDTGRDEMEGRAEGD